MSHPVSKATEQKEHPTHEIHIDVQSGKHVVVHRKLVSVTTVLSQHLLDIVDEVRRETRHTDNVT